MNQNDDLDTNSDEIDLRDLIFPIWAARKQILSIALIFAVLGGILGFLTPETYTASSTFLPQTTQVGGAGGSLGGLAALAGINLNSPLAGADIPPTLYSRVLGSEPFRKRLLDAKIWVDGDSISYRDYLDSLPPSALVTIQEYTIGLPGKVLGALVGDRKDEVSNVEGGLQPLPDKEYAFHNALASKVNLETDKKEGVVSLTVVEGDPMVAAQVAKVTEEVLQDWIIEHKIKNAKAQYDFITIQFESKQKEFFSIQDQLARHRDSNQNVFSSTYQTRFERLQAEFDLLNTVYSELAKQKEQAAIQLSKDTPTFSNLDPVRVPKKKSGPNKSIYVLCAFFIGLILSSCWFLVQKPFKEFIKEILVKS
jgi:uncharacterized protein involved in exopolysaccharide biosynthesis